MSRDSFERHAYINMADEFDPMGSPYGPDKPMAFYEDEWDPEYIAGARRFADEHDLPYPWHIRSLDNALQLMQEKGI